VVTLENLEKWLLAPAETEQLEFKEAKPQYDTTKLLRYCVALANEGGGHFVLGITNKPPRTVVGTQAFPSVDSLNSIKALIVERLRFRVEVTELNHTNGRVLVFEIPTRPVGQALTFEGAYLMRAGEDLVPMTPDRLKRIFAEDQQDWFSQAARSNASNDDVIALLNTQTYFELLDIPYPTHRDAVLARLQSQDLIQQTS